MEQYFQKKEQETKEYLKKFRRLSKDEVLSTLPEKRIAILSSTSIQFLTQVLAVQLAEAGYHAIFYEGLFNNIIGEVLDENSALHHFKPDYILILDDYKSLELTIPAFADDALIEQTITHNVAKYKMIWEKINESFSCEMLQSNFVLPLERVYEQMEQAFPFTQHQLIVSINERIFQQKPKNVHIVDLNFLAMKIGLYQWYDETNYYLSKLGINYEYLPSVAKQFVNKIVALNGKVKKVIVLDLDNTLWGGVIGDDGVLGIKLGNESAEGEAFVAFQKYLLSLKQRGILLAVCSKNEEETAKIPFLEHQEMVLGLEDIVCFKANWQDKASNIREIAQTLNLGLDAFVFVDDNPAERLIVQQYLPMVSVVDLSSDPALYIRDLEQSQLFDWVQLTKEDIARNDSYIQDTKRQQLASTFVNYNEYLDSLEMQMRCKLLAPDQVERFSQLTQKSNQFNLRTVRYSENEINNLRTRDEYQLFAVTLSDRFSNYGLIACVVLCKQSDTTFFIENWLMSCRVLKRGVENFTLQEIIKHIQKMGAKKLLGEYIPTAKNKLVQDFYENLGFTNCGDNKFELEIK